MKKRLQNTAHYTFRKEPPLEDCVVGATGTDDPLEVIRPAYIGHVGRVTDVLLKLGPCVRKQLSETHVFVQEIAQKIQNQI